MVMVEEIISIGGWGLQVRENMTLRRVNPNPNIFSLTQIQIFFVNPNPNIFSHEKYNDDGQGQEGGPHRVPAAGLGHHQHPQGAPPPPAGQGRLQAAGEDQ